MPSGFRSYVVKQGDTLEGVAAAKLGYAGRWREIAALNRLRYPYISARPADRQGPAQSFGRLPNLVAVGSRDIRLAGERRETCVPGAILFFDGHDRSGEYRWDELAILAFDPATQVASCATATGREWPAGTAYRVFPNPNELPQRVATVGDRLLLPLPDADTGGVIDTGEGDEALYGVDILIGEDGRLVMADGDLATVSGVANATQALRLRASLPHGSYLLHPEEGNRSHELIGRNIFPETPFRAEVYSKEAIMRDPRVRAVTASRAVVPAADRIEIEVTALLASSEREVAVNAALRQGGQP